MRNILIATFALLFFVACTQEGPVSDETSTSDAGATQEQPTSSLGVMQENEPHQSMQQMVNDEIDMARDNLIAKHPEIGEAILYANQIRVRQGLNLYEFVTNQGVLYSNIDADFVLIGNVLLGSGEGVTNISEREELLVQLNEAAGSMEEETVSGRDVFQSLPMHAGMTYLYGEAENHVAVFEDPDCAFCQQFHQELEDWGSEVGLRVTVFPYSLERHPNSMERSKAMYCSDDKERMWKKWMSDSREESDMDSFWATWSVENDVTNTDCPQAVVVEAMQLLGRDMEITATPTILFPNGMTIEGLPEREMFEGAMNMR